MQWMQQQDNVDSLFCGEGARQTTMALHFLSARLKQITSTVAKSTLPQPPPEANDQKNYTYVTYDSFESDWLGDPCLLQSHVMGKKVVKDLDLPASNGRYSAGTLVWVLLSKRKPKDNQASSASGYDAMALHKKRRNKKNKGSTAQEHEEATSAKSGSTEQDNHGNEHSQQALYNPQEHEEEATSAKSDSTEQNNLEALYNRSKKEFFLRARVISDDEEVNDELSQKQRSERRVLVRYSKGATYRVRAYNLLPVLEPNVHNTALPPLVVLTPETHIYRRMAKIHCTPEDSFMEIGCDYGITVDKIQTSIEEAGDVPKEWPCNEVNHEVDEKKEDNDGNCTRVSCVGVDKSVESITIANERYPKCKFMLANILVSEEVSTIRTMCETNLRGEAPSIICIDVNGNREIDGVLQCLQMIMNERWKRQPRMIIVKSRFLYWDLKERKPVDDN